DEDLGDGVLPEKASQWKDFFARLDRAIKAEFPFRVILSDPLADSYIQNPRAPEADPQLSIEEYERSAEEDEELGLDDMRTKLANDGEYVKDERNDISEEVVQEIVVDERQQGNSIT
ncbi:MAG: hypothetical protein Q9164_007638, partial [Protoblastenia rupestris]